MGIRKGIIGVCILMICLFLAAHADAATYYVPDDYATIQSAIDGVANGDTIMVRPGTYYENLSIQDKSVNIISTGGAENTVIDGNQSGTVVYMFRSSGRLEGFTIRNGSDSGVHAYVWSSPTIAKCIIEDNNGDRGAGLKVTFVSFPSVHETIIRNNRAEHYGGGVYGWYAGPNIYDSVITDNEAGIYGGGSASAYCRGYMALFRTFVTNNSAPYGGGLSLFGGYGTCFSNAYAINSIISGNSSEYGGGIYVGDGGSLKLNLSTVVDNTADYGGGIYSDGNINRSYNNIVYFNSTLPVIKNMDVWNFTLDHSIIEGGLDRPGIIDADPLFVDLEGGDYHLSPGSPAIDSGIAYWHLPDHDIEGTPRPLDAGYDMGAYEFTNCKETPTVEITSVSPEAIWPPNNKETDVVVSGTVTVPEDCVLMDASYAVDDEYGVYTGSGDLIVGEDGSFELIMTVEASRLGSDKDGRNYDVTISATDEAGESSASSAAIVLHDMR